MYYNVLYSLSATVIKGHFSEVSGNNVEIFIQRLCV